MAERLTTRTRATRDQAREFAQLIAEYEPRVARAFMASVVDLQSNVDWEELINALEARDLDRAVAALNIDPAAFEEYSSRMTETYARAGASTVAQVQAIGLAGIGTRFNMTNPRAERWIQENVANRIVDIVEEQIFAVREVILAGYEKGKHPRNIAYDIVGRVGATGLREGGIIGLDTPRMRRYMAVSEGMATAEGVKDLVIVHRDGSVSMRFKVNKATAQRIEKAYHAGTAVPEAQRRISEQQYYNALLKARGDTIANTEVANAVMSAREEEWHQALEKRGLPAGAVIKEWRHRRGPEPYAREQHMEMDGVRVEGLDTPFTMPDGTQMQHAHDINGGAKHCVLCGCDTIYYLAERYQRELF